MTATRWTGNRLFFVDSLGGECRHGVYAAYGAGMVSGLPYIGLFTRWWEVRAGRVKSLEKDYFYFPGVGRRMGMLRGGRAVKP